MKVPWSPPFDAPRPRRGSSSSTTIPASATYLDFLGRHGYTVETAADAPGLDAALAPRDRPGGSGRHVAGEDGLAICRRLAADRGRPSSCSAHGGERPTDRRAELGADDYLPSRAIRASCWLVRAVLRRRKRAAADRSGRRASRRLASGPGAARAALPPGRGGQPDQRRVLPAPRLRRPAAKGSDPRPLCRPGAGPRQRGLRQGHRLQISRLRRKLEDGADGQELIRTIRNEGYMFDARFTRR